MVKFLNYGCGGLMEMILAAQFRFIIEGLGFGAECGLRVTSK